MSTSLTRRYMMERMERSETAFDAAKKKAHFFALQEGTDELVVTNIDRENQTLSYNFADNPAAQDETISAADFNRYFTKWTDNSQAKYGKRFKARQEIDRVWETAHEEHQDFLIREAAAAGDAEAVMALVEQIRTKAKNEARALQDTYENYDTTCGDPHCEVCS